VDTYGSGNHKLMAGILDQKTRIFDTIVTLEGRRQIATGKLRAEYFSFTDAGAFYNQDTLSGSDDAGRRITFEASSLPQDQIAFEADDSGRLVPFRGSTVPVSNGKIVTFITGVSGSVRNEVAEVDGDQFSSEANRLLDASLTNFNKLYIIGSPDLFDENRNEFLVSKEKIKFDITNGRPISNNHIQTLNINHIESFFQDKRLSHVPNFQYLPPVNKARPGTRQHRPLGYYARLGQQPYFEFANLGYELNQLKQTGYEEVIEFTETSKTNNLMCQLFELSDGEVVKLDVIDFGIFHVGSEPFSAQQVTEEELYEAKREGRELDLERQTKHVFFAGKIFKDSRGTHTFVNMFTLVFE
jgi:hypothetical protein